MVTLGETVNKCDNIGNEQSEDNDRKYISMLIDIKLW